MSIDSTDQGPKPIFQPLTALSLQTDHSGPDDSIPPKPDPIFEDSKTLPSCLRPYLPRDLVGSPLEDIDKFYWNQKTFVVINRWNDIFRFSSQNSLWCLSPLNRLRNLAVRAVAHHVTIIFYLLVILAHCITMTIHTPTARSSLVIFDMLFIVEMLVKIVAMGFVLQPSSYLRDPWNRLDFIVILLEQAAMGIEMGSYYSQLRAFRLLKVLKTVHIIPGIRIVAGAFIQSMKNLFNVLVFTVISLSIFAIVSLQLYQKNLKGKCIEDLDSSYYPDKQFPHNNESQSRSYFDCNLYAPTWSCKGNPGCDNSSYIENAYFNFASFDNFGMALLSMFRFLALDYWESLYHLILNMYGSVNMLVFVLFIFLCSFFLSNLILVSVVTSYNQVQDEDDDISTNDEALRLRFGLDLIPDSSTNDELTTTTVPAPEEVTDTKSSIELKALPELKDITVVNDIVTQAADTNNDNKSDSPNFITHCGNGCLRVVDILCIWQCCSCWVKMQKCLHAFVHNGFFQLFILICIISNTFLLVVITYEGENMNSFPIWITIHTFSAIFLLEFVIKVLALSPKNYFKNGWNLVDFIAVLAIIFHFLRPTMFIYVVALRSLRLVRAIRLVKCFPTANFLISVMRNSAGAFGNLTFVMIIIISTLALLGHEVFAYPYARHVHALPEKQCPRWHFMDFSNSFMLVFRIFCGEWIESMTECMSIAGFPCIIFYVLTTLIGHLVIVNFFLAIVLSSFKIPNSHYETDLETENLQNALRGIGDCFHSIKLNIQSTVCGKVTIPISAVNAEESDAVIINEQVEHEVTILEEPQLCYPDCCYKVSPFCGSTGTKFWTFWADLRIIAFRIVDSVYFKMFVTIIILISSVALALEDKFLDQKPLLQVALVYLNRVIVLIFVLEMFIKWLAFGFKKYFTDSCCWLEFLVTVASLVFYVLSLMGMTLTAFHQLRILRIIQPVIYISFHCSALRIVLKTVSSAIPAIFSALLVTSLFWLIFSLFGVRRLRGTFFSCQFPNGTKADGHVITHEYQCRNQGYRVNSPINFDNVGNAYLALFQVATLKGWDDLMQKGMGATEMTPIDKSPNWLPYQHPCPDSNNKAMFIFFFVFIIIVTFLTFNLFAGIIIMQYNEQKKIVNSSLDMFMTQVQKKYYNTIRRIRSWKPVAVVPRPTGSIRAKIFDIVTDNRFNMAMLIIVGLNLLVLVMYHNKMPQPFTDTINILQLCFLLIFILECTFKIFALRTHYFQDPWNVLDFCVTIFITGSLAFLVPVLMFLIVSPSVFAVARVARISPVLRTAKMAKGIRILLLTFHKSFSGLLSTFLLLTIVMTIYSIFGMAFFMDVKIRGGLDLGFNFHNFINSMKLLFQLSTTAGWTDVLATLMNQTDCLHQDEATYVHGAGCGNVTAAIVYLVSYVAICTFIIMNLFIAVILDSYNKATEELQDEISNDDYDNYYRVWQHYDPKASGYVHYEDLEEFLDALDPPLNISKPNKYRIINMDIAIYRGNLLFCTDILEALIKDYFSRQGYIDGADNYGFASASGNKPISSTLRRQREDASARLIQKALRQHQQKTDVPDDQAAEVNVEVPSGS